MKIELLVTIVLAFIGYIATYFYNLRLSKRKGRLELIEKRINEFYGPLYISNIAGKTTYLTLLKKLGKKQVFDETDPPDEKQLKEWRIWSETVFRPLNSFNEELIYKNAHLLMDEEIPRCLIDFVTCVSEWKTILKKWELGDFSEQTAMLDYPEELLEYAKQAYLKLKKEQLKLIGEDK